MKRDILVSIDPSSHNSGIALLTLSGEFITTFPLVSKASLWSNRFLEHHQQFAAKIAPYVDRVATICYEKNVRSSVALLAQLGALAICLPGALINDATGVCPQSWKKYWRMQTNIKKASPKGLEDLRLLGGIYANMNISEDESDALLIALCYLDKVNNHE